MADDKRIEDKDLLVLLEKSPEAGEKYNKNGFKLRVCQWLYGRRDGSVGGAVKLERRQLYIGDDGTTRNGKAEGFTLDDLGLIQKSWKQIIEIMKNPPEPAWPVKEQAPQSAQAPANDPGIDEVPF